MADFVANGVKFVSTHLKSLTGLNQGNKILEEGKT